MIDPLTEVATQMPRASRTLETARVLNRAQNASFFNSIVGVKLFCLLILRWGLYMFYLLTIMASCQMYLPTVCVTFSTYMYLYLWLYLSM